LFDTRGAKHPADQPPDPSAPHAHFDERGWETE
jgi:hypothetical protein